MMTITWTQGAWIALALVSVTSLALSIAAAAGAFDTKEDGRGGATVPTPSPPGGPTPPPPSPTPSVRPSPSPKPGVPTALKVERVSLLEEMAKDSSVGTQMRATGDLSRVTVSRADGKMHEYSGGPEGISNSSPSRVLTVQGEAVARDYTPDGKWFVAFSRNSYLNGKPFVVTGRVYNAGTGEFKEVGSPVDVTVTQQSNQQGQMEKVVVVGAGPNAWDVFVPITDWNSGVPPPDLGDLYPGRVLHFRLDGSTGALTLFDQLHNITQGLNFGLDVASDGGKLLVASFTEGYEMDGNGTMVAITNGLQVFNRASPADKWKYSHVYSMPARIGNFTFKYPGDHLTEVGVRNLTFTPDGRYLYASFFGDVTNASLWSKKPTRPGCVIQFQVLNDGGFLSLVARNVLAQHVQTGVTLAVTDSYVVPTFQMAYTPQQHVPPYHFAVFDHEAGRLLCTQGPLEPNTYAKRFNDLTALPVAFERSPQELYFAFGNQPVVGPGGASNPDQISYLGIYKMTPKQ